MSIPDMVQIAILRERSHGRNIDHNSIDSSVSFFDKFFHLVQGSVLGKVTTQHPPNNILI